MQTQIPFPISPLALAVLLLPALSAAQTAARAGDSTPRADDETGARIQQVVVSAAKRREEAQKTSLSVQSLNGEILQREGKRRLDEAVEGLAGIQLQPANVGMTINVRGIDGGSTGVRPNSGFGQADASANPGVAVVVDGVYQARPEALRGALFDTTRVEVLRGNQSTLLGGNAVVGALNVVTAQPVFGNQGRIGMELGNYQRRAINGVFNVQLAEDHALRFAVQKSERDGYTASNGDNEDLLAWRLRYRWQPTDQLNLVAGVERSEIGGTGLNQGALLYQGQWVPYAPGSRTRPASVTANGRTTLNVNSLGCEILGAPTAVATDYATLGCGAGGPSYMISNKGQTGTLYRDRSNPWDDGLPAGAYGSDVFSSASITTYSLALEYDTPIGQLVVTPSRQEFHRGNAEPVRGTTQNLAHQVQITDQLEVRMTSAEGSRSPLKWLGGFNLFHSTTDAFNGQAFNKDFTLPSTVRTPGTAPTNVPCTVVTCYAWASSPDTKQETQSVFGNAEYSVLPSLRVLAGLRHQEDKKTTTSSVFLYSGGDAAGATGIDFRFPVAGQTARYKDTNYRAGLEFDVTPDVMLYGTKGTGYQPGVVDFDTTTPSNPQMITYKQSAIDQLTLGFKSRWLDGRLQVNAEAFQTRFSQYPLNASPTARGYNVNTKADTGTCAHPISTVRGILATVNSAGVLCIVDGNAPTVESAGVDLDVTWAITPVDRLFLSAEYLKTKITDGDPRFATADRVQASVANWASLAGGASSVSAENAAAGLSNLAAAMSASAGLGLANSPRVSLTAAYQHTFTFSDKSRLTTRVQAVHKSQYWTSGQGQALPLESHAAAVQPAYTQWNLFANWTSASGKYDLSAYVRNVNNTVVLQNLNTGPGWWTVSLAPPRTYGLTASMRF